MGLFDKLRGNDDSEEVELKLPRESTVNRPRGVSSSQRARNDSFGANPDEEVEIEDIWSQNQERHRNQRRMQRRKSSQRQNRSSSTDGPDASDSGDFILPGMKSVSTGADEEKDERSFDGPEGEKLDRLLEQNERIISLLEDIVDKSDTDFSETGMW